MHKDIPPDFCVAVCDFKRPTSNQKRQKATEESELNRNIQKVKAD
jgi:hypothetical protein